MDYIAKKNEELPAEYRLKNLNERIEALRKFKGKDKEQIEKRYGGEDMVKTEIENSWQRRTENWQRWYQRKYAGKNQDKTVEVAGTPGL